MNRDEVKQILLAYRPGTLDAGDPEIAEALALAGNDPELAHWLEEHCARQNALREKIRQIPIYPALKEQIISEQAARGRAASRRERIVGVAAVAVILISLLVMGVVFMPHRSTVRPIPNTLASYQSQMINAALNPYYMQSLTNSTDVHSYFAQNQAPSDYVLPAGLQKMAITGCTIESWQNSKACMICFRTGKPLAPGQQSDLWLFVVDSGVIPDAPTADTPQYIKVNGLMTAAWTQNGKFYLLGTEGDEQTIQKFL
jgi:hypothetical protein